MENSNNTESRWRNLDEKAILFWYRQSPRSLSLTLEDLAPDNPPLQFPGEVQVVLDTEGRLVSLRAVPPSARSASATASNPDWNIFFAAAGLEPSQFTLTETQWNPDSYADTTATWKGLLANRSRTPIKIQAAALQWKPILFKIMGPWDQAAQQESPQSMMVSIIAVLALALLLLTVFLGGIFLARRNLRLGRGDRRNANRLALFILGLSALEWILTLPKASILGLVTLPYLAGLLWVFYIALEPFMRRRWPQSLVTWTRLLSGDWRDPLVSRDVLVGCAAAVLVMCVDWFAHYLLPPLLGHVELAMPFQCPLTTFMGSRFFLSNILTILSSNIAAGLFLICLLCILMMLLKNQRAAIVVCCLGLALITPPNSHSLWSVAIKLCMSPIFIILLLRFGFLASAASMVGTAILRFFPIGLQSAWYSGYGYAALAIIAVIVLYAFRTAIGRQPLLAASRFDD